MIKSVEERFSSLERLIALANTLEQASDTDGEKTAKTLKGLFFVHLYGIYEETVRKSVRTRLRIINDLAPSFSSMSPGLLAIALDDPLKSIEDSTSPKKRWSTRQRLFQKAQSAEAASLNIEVFPIDGSHFRLPQLELIWELFGLEGSHLPDIKDANFINEMVAFRNEVAHGRSAPDQIGGRFTVQELNRRRLALEAVCLHIATALNEPVEAPPERT